VEPAANPKLREHLVRAVVQVNRTRARPAQVKRFVLVGEQWNPESGCVTPTMKMKRRVAMKQYTAQIDDR
jgi:long-chain acyl-CoA synthetase